MKKAAYFPLFEIEKTKRKELGNLIRGIRESKNLSLNSLARRALISPTKLHFIETGKKNNINPFELKSIGKVLYVDYMIFYKIVGFLEENNFSEKNKLKNNEIDYFQRKLVDQLISSARNKIDEEYMKEIIGLIDKLDKSKIDEWIMYGKYLSEKD